MQKGSASEHHRQLTRVVRVVEPLAWVTDIKSVKSARKTNHSVTRLTPHPGGRWGHKVM